MVVRFCQILTIQYFQAPSIQGYQNQYAPQAPVALVFRNQYTNNKAGIPSFYNQYASSASQHSPASCNQLAVSNHDDQQKALHLHGSSSNVSSVNRVSESSRAPCQDSVTSNVHMANKVQIPTNPLIALQLGTPKVDKSNLKADSSLKPTYVCVSMPNNDVKAAQEGSEVAVQVTVGSIYFILFCRYGHTTKVNGKLIFAGRLWMLYDLVSELNPHLLGSEK
jgi:hypothetical protein